MTSPQSASQADLPALDLSHKSSSSLEDGRRPSKPGRSACLGLGSTWGHCRTQAVLSVCLFCFVLVWFSPPSLPFPSLPFVASAAGFSVFWCCSWDGFHLSSTSPHWAQWLLCLESRTHVMPFHQLTTCHGPVRRTWVPFLRLGECLYCKWGILAQLASCAALAD